ncbi:Hypothetical predicted protein [Octopus vulgaris]|uniref:Uncharacterized protein n=1 Tax=Octopus vulgaris TaxID=6645 RepID=A0AA36AVU0_OCTVU|nr:Hypothetical predicted protein [Octopus vulgaris]
MVQKLESTKMDNPHFHWHCVPRTILLSNVFSLVNIHAREFEYGMPPRLPIRQRINKANSTKRLQRY